MKKRLTALILSCILLLSPMSLWAATYSPGIDVVQNGGFEASGGWASAGHSSYTKEKFNRGGTSLRFELEDDNLNTYSAQTFTNVIPGATYTLTFFIMIEDMSEQAKAEIKFEVYSADNKGLQGVSFTGFTPKIGKWRKYTRTITLDKNAHHMSLLLRWFGKGIVYFDDISLTVPQAEFKNNQAANQNQIPTTMPDPYEGALELIENGSFEKIKSNNTPEGEGWLSYKNWQEGYVSLTKDAHTGNSAVHIKTDNGGNPWVCYLVPISPNTSYVVSTFLKPKGVVGRVCYKFEFYTKTMASTATSYDTPDLQATDDTWTQYIQEFTAPAGAYFLKVYARLYGNGELFVDDMTAYATSAAPSMDIFTDHEFYYTEWGGNVKVTGEMNTTAYPDLAGGKVHFTLSTNDELLLDLGEAKVTDGIAETEFPISVMETIGQEYIIKGDAFTKDGKSVGAKTKNVFRYNRPTIINDDNMIEIDGEIFVPKYYYHGECTEKGILEQKSYGANTILIDADYITLGTMLEDILDICEKHDMKAILCTYLNMDAGGHINNRANTQDACRRVKDHPAMLGYLTSDEPYTTIGATYAEDLHDTYRVIRDIDPYHLVITNEASPSGFSTVAKRADLTTHDPYIGENAFANSPVDFVGKRMKLLKENADKKPTIAVLQTFYWGMNAGINGVYFPTADEVRHMTYQSLLQDTIGIAFYSFLDPFRDSATRTAVPLPRTRLGPGLKKFAEFELDEALDFFVLDKYPAFSSFEGEKYSYYSWVHGEDIYMIILDLNTSYDPMPGQNITIPLTSDNGKVTIGKYTAELLAGGDEDPTVGEGTLPHRLRWRQAAFYKITPETPVDVSLLAAE